MPDNEIQQVMTTTYVEYLLSGLFFPEEEVAEVADRDPKREARLGPANAYAFSYFDITTAVVDVGGESVETESSRRNSSKTYYIDAELLDVDAVQDLPGDHEILLGNMHNNGWDPIARCRLGNFQPFDPTKHELISSA